MTLTEKIMDKYNSVSDSEKQEMIEFVQIIQLKKTEGFLDVNYDDPEESQEE